MFALWRRVQSVRLKIPPFNSLLKGMGDKTLIGLLHVMPKTHPLLIKRIGTTCIDHADHFPVVKIAKVDLDTP